MKMMVVRYSKFYPGGRYSIVMVYSPVWCYQVLRYYRAMEPNESVWMVPAPGSFDELFNKDFRGDKVEYSATVKEFYEGKG